MNVTAPQNNVHASDVPMERLANNSSLTEEQKVGEVARQFEAVLLRQILAQSQKTVFSSSMTDNSTASGIYRDMATNQLADSISKSGALGLSQTLEQQLSHQVLSSTQAAKDPTAETLPNVSSAGDVARPLHSRRTVARVVRSGPQAFETNPAH